MARADVAVAQFNTARIISFIDIKLSASLCLRASVVQNGEPQRHRGTETQRSTKFNVNEGNDTGSIELCSGHLRPGRRKIFLDS